MASPLDVIGQILALLATLINPTTLAVGAFISHGMEQLTWFKREDVPDALKFLVMFLACEVAAVILAVFGSESLPSTLAAWRMVFLTGVAIAMGSTGFHLFINKYIPGLGDYLKTLSNKTITSATLTTGTGASVSSTTTVTNIPDLSATPITGTPPVLPVVEGEHG